MIVLVAAMALQTQVVTPPRGPQSVEEIQAISQYIAAISMRASILRACEGFVAPNALDDLRSGLTDLAEIAHVKQRFAEMADTMIAASANQAPPFEGEASEAKCKTYLGLADGSLEEYLPRFREILPIFVGEVRSVSDSL